MYDFIEFVVAHVSDQYIQIEELCEKINRVLVEENSAYRIIR